jgi:hypothetical protein
MKFYFHHEAHDEPVMTPEKKFETEFCNILFYSALISLKERFEQLHQHTETWGFMYKISKLLKKEEHIKHCLDSQLSVIVGSDVDIEKSPLCDEVISPQSLVKKLKNAVPLNILNFMKKFNVEDLYAIIWVSLRILLTMPVSVASGESFSKLKLINTYLRSSVLQDIDFFRYPFS